MNTKIYSIVNGRSSKLLLFLLFTVLVLTESCNNKKSAVVNKSPKTEKFSSIAFLLYDNFDTSLLNYAVSEATAFYKCKAILLPSQEIPSFAYYKPRGRYKADSLLKYQSRLLPVNAQSVVGLTTKDISTSHGEYNDWGIFGFGYRPGSACVVSTFRLTSTTYGQFKERFAKVLLHELGHNQGLPHCEFDSTCLMANAKGTIAQVDKEKKWLCGNCQKLLSN